jgi:hypothetical protein
MARSRGLGDVYKRQAYIRRLQHQLVERFNLSSRSVGDEPQRRLRILPPAGTQKNLGYI